MITDWSKYKYVNPLFKEMLEAILVEERLEFDLSVRQYRTAKVDVFSHSYTAPDLHNDEGGGTYVAKKKKSAKKQ